MDARSDIFAVGVILDEMLTGNRAFQKATSVETMMAILNGDPPAISQVPPNLSPGLQKIVNRCLAKNPDQRFQHASDFGFALEALSDASSTAMPAIAQQAASKRWTWIAVSADRPRNRRSLRRVVEATTGGSGRGRCNQAHQ